MEEQLGKRKSYSASLKSKVALEAIQGDMTIAELASRYGLNPNMITRWKKQAVEGLKDAFSRGGHSGNEPSDQARIKELHAKIGELTVERDFLATAFGR